MSDLHETSREGPEFVPVDGAADASAQADELFVHGVLGTVHERADGAIEKRMERFGASARSLNRARVSNSGRRLRKLVGIASVVVVALACTWILITPATNSARATLMASISAAKGAGERRYEIRAVRAADAELPKEPEAVVDQADGLFLLRAHTPEGRTAIAGRDQAGEWAIRREGGIERKNPRRAWPGWATTGGESIFAESIETLLEALTADFELTPLADEHSANGRTLRRIDGVKRPDAPRRAADRVQLWIDADTMLLERLEMDWDKGPGGIAGPIGERPPPPRGDGPPHGPDGMPPFDPNRPPPPPPHDGPNGERGLRPPPSEGEMGRGGPNGPAGPHGPGPEPRKGGIRKLVLTRVDAPDWAPEWFTPEKHADGGWGEP